MSKIVLIRLEGCFLTDMMDEDSKKKLTNHFRKIIDVLPKAYTMKVWVLIKHIPEICRLHNLSLKNRKTKSEDPSKYHPIRPMRGEIYNAIIHENIGSELCGNHLVVIVSNNKGNLYGEKVNVLPIEGDGNKVNPNYQIRLDSSELIIGKLDKNPSRIIMTDIMTIDKARLDVRVGKLTNEKMNQINISLLKILGLRV